MPIHAAHVYLGEGDREGGVAAPTTDLIGAFGEGVDVATVPIEDGHRSNPWYWYRLGRRASTAGDVVHVHFNYDSFGRLAGRFPGVGFPVFAAGLSGPVVTTLHNLQYLGGGNPHDEPAPLARVKRTIDRSLVGCTDHFVTLSATQRERLVDNGIDPDRVTQIPLVPEADPTLRDSEACKAELGLTGNRVLTGFGWVRRTKGYDRVIAALPDLPEDTVFLIAGGTRTESQAAYVEELRQSVTERGLEDRVRFLGYVEDYPTVMNATDVMVLPYTDDRPSDALVRGLSYRLPVVASDTPEFRALYDLGECFELVSDDAELSATLERLLTDESARAELARAAGAFASETNWETVAAEIEGIYRDVVASGGD
jgi:glycosyltransferase involved in cell wall biosynthesis